MVDQIPLQVPRCRAHHDEADTYTECCPSHKFHGVCSTITREPTDGSNHYHTASNGLRQGQFFAMISPTYAPEQPQMQAQESVSPMVRQAPVTTVATAKRTFTLMAVHAHPDDESSGTGGLLCLAAEQGHT